ncbi:hypothetical protein PR003_g29238 [Phytophthora rubi]|uniref:Uncharacterized protein n=1 Tax=Phytophthora rubi TaxID=129364 RepID=A0A6A3HE69_9STRA|nr:hypothetical protein PR001_g28200 [Phytophthora rubi]KAE9275790.1 hypothetical protein PR003_g29238 [Phytophthora rubi]
MVAGCHWQHPTSTGSGAGTFSAASDDNADQTRKQHMQTQIQTFALSVDPFATLCRGDGVALCHRRRRAARDLLRAEDGDAGRPRARPVDPRQEPPTHDRLSRSSPLHGVRHGLRLRLNIPYIKT